MPITHAFTNPKADGGDATVVRPSDWNAAHIVDATTLPGYEFDYVQSSGSTAISATSAATETTVLTSSAVVFDGSTVIYVEAFSPRIQCGRAVGAGLFIELYDGSTDLETIAWVQSDATAISVPMRSSRRLTPSAGSHTYSVRGWRQVANGTFGPGGGTGDHNFIRITRAV